MKGTELSNSARTIIKNKQLLAQQKGRGTIQKHRQEIKDRITATANKLVEKVAIDNDYAKLCASLIFWCEGSKGQTSVRFTNSDPTLIKLFLNLLRKGFMIDETKLRALIHLHEYHNELQQKAFWSDVTKIPLSQFSRSYLKPHTGKNKRANYPGCLAVYYYDSKVAKELSAIYNAFTSRGVG